MRMTVDPQRLYISSCSPLARNPLEDYIGEAIDIQVAGGLRYYTHTTNDVLSTSELIKMFKPEKETEKMEAKKCDRCGKLYEMPRANGSGAKVRFKFKTVYEAEEKSKTKIIEEQTNNIYIKCGCMGDGFVDLCPECRESLKKWFEEA